MAHTVFITGAAGYVGTMLVRSLANRGDVDRIVALDREPIPDLIKNEPKLVYIQANTSDEGWEEKVRPYAPDVVIHAAWQIREFYGDRKKSWKWNIHGSDRVFDFAFGEPTVARLIYFSTVASYGAFPENTIQHRFTETEPFRKSEYLYAEEKRIAEEHLKEKFEKARKAGKATAVSIVRPAAITGPRGRFMRIRFGLQAALAGQLKDNIFYRIISLLVSFVPVTPNWCRQFIHEDDVVRIIELLAFGVPAPSGGETREAYEIFNICPPGDVVRGPDMAKAVGKRLMRVSPQFLRIGFFFAWHGSRGKIPTARGAWRGYSYPIAVDGGKLTKVLGYRYKHAGYDAFYYTDGEYEEFVPSRLRRSKA